MASTVAGGVRVDERTAAIAAVDGTCPRCGSAREREERYCVECGFALPPVGGALAGLRRRWIRRLGWYPGDFVWAALATLVVAAAGAAAAIVLAAHGPSRGTSYLRAPATVAVASPAPAASTVDTSTLPSPPEPTTPAASGEPPAVPNGRLTWPETQNGWTVVLVSYPKADGTAAARTAALRAARGLRQVGVLDSSKFASLQPGYLVVFSGIYTSRAAAAAAIPTARQAGFRGAYTREVAR